MTLLDAHLEQITLSAAAIADLPFPAPKIFTNALLSSHDITTLIRDTEAHERILFSFASPDKENSAVVPNPSRRSTLHPNKNNSVMLGNAPDLSRLQREKSAVTNLLGGELQERLRSETTQKDKERGEANVDILLKGAEKLCSIYPIPGTKDKIAALKSRHSQLTSSTIRYETKISKQTAQLSQLNCQKDFSKDQDSGSGSETDVVASTTDEAMITVEDIKMEEEEILELEKKKRSLEDRVSGMEKDLGGLLR